MFLDCMVMTYMGGRKRNFLLGRQKGQKGHKTHSAVLCMRKNVHC